MAAFPTAAKVAELRDLLTHGALTEDPVASVGLISALEDLKSARWAPGACTLTA